MCAVGTDSISFYNIIVILYAVMYVFLDIILAGDARSYLISSLSSREREFLMIFLLCLGSSAQEISPLVVTSEYLK